jgi:hypothetical protein
LVVEHVKTVHAKLRDPLLDLDAVGVGTFEPVVDPLDPHVLDLDVACRRDPDAVGHVRTVDLQSFQVDGARRIAEAHLDGGVVLVRVLGAELVDGDLTTDDDDIPTAVDSRAPS